MKIAHYSPSYEEQRRDWTGEVSREVRAESGRLIPALRSAPESQAKRIPFGKRR